MNTFFEELYEGLPETMVYAKGKKMMPIMDDPADFGSYYKSLVG